MSLNDLTVAPPPPSKLRELWVIPHNKMSPAEQVLAQTLQGIIGRKQPRIWIRSGSMYAIVEAQLRREGVQLREASSVWELLPPFQNKIKGAVLYRLGTPSLNVATSLSGPLNGVAVDEALWERVQKATGWKVLADVREMDERQAWAKHRSLFAHGIAVEQAIEKPGHLRDFAAARNAFTFFTKDSGFRTEVLRALGPNATVYGWGPDEYDWIADLSRANATGGPADWAMNLSALERLPAGKLKRPTRPALHTEDNVRYVAFVMSDGDNIQWLCNGFVDSPKYWGSPLRGQFPMTWEVSALLPQVAPRVLQHLYATAHRTDAFVAGPGAPGYTFPHFQTDRPALARQSAPLLRTADLPHVSVLNANAGDLRDTMPLLDLPEVKGVLYKDYAPYHRSNGKIFWHRGKPCLSYKFLLWEKLMGPEDLAAGVAKMPSSPRTDAGSYAIVNVHAWSYDKEGGPMEAVQRALKLLPANTRVVTADQIFGLLQANRRGFARG